MQFTITKLLVVALLVNTCGATLNRMSSMQRMQNLRRGNTNAFAEVSEPETCTANLERLDAV
jgi:hypothetical protein